jgi:hypothetical protein
MNNKNEKFVKVCEEILEENTHLREYTEHILITKLLPKYDPKGQFTPDMIEELIYSFMIGVFKENMIKWKKSENEQQ